MFEKHYKKLLKYIHFHPGGNCHTISMDNSLSFAIINSTIDELKERGFIDLTRPNLYLSEKGRAYLEINGLIKLKKEIRDYKSKGFFNRLPIYIPILYDINTIIKRYHVGTKLKKFFTSQWTITIILIIIVYFMTAILKALFPQWDLP